MMSTKSVKNLAKYAKSGKNKLILAIAVIVLVVTYLVVGPLNLLSVVGNSYSNAYEGAKPSFAGIVYNGQKYASNSGNPYYANTGMGFSFKGDGPASQYSGLPKVVGEMTPVFIPQNTNAGDLPSTFNVGGVTVPNPFTSSFSLIRNPYHTYVWNISRGSSTTLYQMEEWKTKYYVSISANPDGAQAAFTNSEWDQNNGRYSDVQIWIKLDTAPTWYFEGQDQAYFAIAQVQLSGITYQGHDSNGAVQASHNVQNIIVNPSSPSSATTLFANNFGANNAKAADTNTVYSYRGATLNPLYFGNAVYFCITLNSFGSQSWWDFPTWKAQGDVVNFDFTITQFVVGQWTVQNIQQVPSGYGRQSSYSEFGLSGVTGFLNFLGTPFGLLLLTGVILLAVIIAVFVVIVMYAPWLLTSMSGFFKKGKGKQT